MKFKRGFSLLELLLVVAVVAGIFAFSAPLTMNFYRTQLINDVQSNLIDALQRARHNAVLQKNDSNFGVHIVRGSYTLFQTPDLTYASHVSDQDEVFPVVSSIAFDGPTDIIFSKLTGIPVATGTIAMAYDILVKGVTIDSSGVISKDDSVIFVGSCVATGGTITESGGYTIHTFTDTGSDTFTVTSGSCDAEVLVVAGGGGGGSFAGGGGAGGVIYNPSYAITSQTYTVTVGSGGNGGTVSDTGVPGNNGDNSVFDSLIAIGGGGGGSRGNPYPNGGPGASGGSGGGGGPSDGGVLGIGGSGTDGQGNDGGSEISYGWGGAGGGGAGTAGGTASGHNGGNGGDGVSNSISGSEVYYGGGGGGGSYSGASGILGIGGLGGGGDGRGNSSFPGNGVSGTENTGGGGGGSDYYYTGGMGGSGIVIVRYPVN